MQRAAEGERLAAASLVRRRSRTPGLLTATSRLRHRKGDTAGEKGENGGARVAPGTLSRALDGQKVKKRHLTQTWSREARGTLLRARPEADEAEDARGRWRRTAERRGRSRRDEKEETRRGGDRGRQLERLSYSSPDSAESGAEPHAAASVSVSYHRGLGSQHTDGEYRLRRVARERDWQRRRREDRRSSSPASLDETDDDRSGCPQPSRHLNAQLTDTEKEEREHTGEEFEREDVEEREDAKFEKSGMPGGEAPVGGREFEGVKNHTTGEADFGIPEGRGQLDQAVFFEASDWLEQIEKAHHCEDMIVIFQAAVLHPRLSGPIVAALAAWAVAWLLPSLLPAAAPEAKAPSCLLDYGAVCALLRPSFRCSTLFSSPDPPRGAMRRAAEREGREKGAGDAGRANGGEREQAEAPTQPPATKTGADRPPAGNGRLVSMRCMLQAFLFSRSSFAVVFLTYFSSCLEDDRRLYSQKAASASLGSSLSSPSSALSSLASSASGSSPFSPDPSSLRPAASSATAARLPSVSRAGRRNPASAGLAAEHTEEGNEGRKRVAAFLASAAGDTVFAGKSGLTPGVCSQDFFLLFSKQEEREKREAALKLKLAEGQYAPSLFFAFPSASAAPAKAVSPVSSRPCGAGDPSGGDEAERTRTRDDREAECAKGAKATGKPPDAKAKEAEGDGHVTSATSTEPHAKTFCFSVQSASEGCALAPSLTALSSNGQSRFLERVAAEAEARTAALFLRLQHSRVFQDTLWDAPLLRVYILNLAVGLLLECPSSLSEDATRCLVPHSAPHPAACSLSLSGPYSLRPSCSAAPGPASSPPSPSLEPHFPCLLCLQGQCGGNRPLCVSRRRLLGPFFLLLASPARLWSFYTSEGSPQADAASLKGAKPPPVSKHENPETSGRENEPLAANAQTTDPATDAPPGHGPPPYWTSAECGAFPSLPAFHSPSLRDFLASVSRSAEHVAARVRSPEARCPALPALASPAPLVASPSASSLSCHEVFADADQAAGVLDSLLLHLGVSLLWLLSVQGCLASLSKAQQLSPSPVSPSPFTSSTGLPSVTSVSPLSSLLSLSPSSRLLARELRSAAFALVEWMRLVACARQTVLASLRLRCCSVWSSPSALGDPTSFSPLAAVGLSLLGLAAPLAASVCDALMPAAAPRVCAFCSAFPASVGPWPATSLPPREERRGDKTAKGEELGKMHGAGETQGGLRASDAHEPLEEMRQAAEKRAGRDSLRILWDLFVGQGSRHLREGEASDNGGDARVTQAARAASPSSVQAGDGEHSAAPVPSSFPSAAGSREVALLHLVFDALTGGPSGLCLTSSSSSFSHFSKSSLFASCASTSGLFERSVARGLIGLDGLVSLLSSGESGQAGGGQGGDANPEGSPFPGRGAADSLSLSQQALWPRGSDLPLRPLSTAAFTPRDTPMAVFLHSPAPAIYSKLGKLERLLRFSSDFTKSANHILLHAACLRRKAEARGVGTGDSQRDAERCAAAKGQAKLGGEAREGEDGEAARVTSLQLLRLKGCMCLPCGVDAVGDLCWSRFPFSSRPSSVVAGSSRFLPPLPFSTLLSGASSLSPGASRLLPSPSGAVTASLPLLLPLPLALHICAAAVLAAPGSVSVAFVCISTSLSSSFASWPVFCDPSLSLPSTASSPLQSSPNSISPSCCSSPPGSSFLLWGGEQGLEVESAPDACLLTPFLEDSEERAGRREAGVRTERAGQHLREETRGTGRETAVSPGAESPALQILPSLPFLRLCIWRILLLLQDRSLSPSLLSTAVSRVSPSFSPAARPAPVPVLGPAGMQRSDKEQNAKHAEVTPTAPPLKSLLPRCDQLVCANLYDVLAAEDSPSGPQSRPSASLPVRASSPAAWVSSPSADVASRAPGVESPLAEAARVVFPSAAASGTLLSLHSSARCFPSLASAPLSLPKSPVAAVAVPATCCFLLFSRLLWREICSDDNLLLEVGCWLCPDGDDGAWDFFLSPALDVPPPPAARQRASPSVSSGRTDLETLEHGPRPSPQETQEARERPPAARAAVLASQEIYVYRSELLQALAVALAFPVSPAPPRRRERWRLASNAGGARGKRTSRRRRGEGRERTTQSEWRRVSLADSRVDVSEERKNEEEMESTSPVSPDGGERLRRTSRDFPVSCASPRAQRDAVGERARPAYDAEDPRGRRRTRPGDLGPHRSSLPSIEKAESSSLEERHPRESRAGVRGSGKGHQSRTQLRASPGTGASLGARDPPPAVTSPAFLLRLCRFTAFRVLGVFLAKREREEYARTLESATHRALWEEGKAEGEKVEGEAAGSGKREATEAGEEESERDREEDSDEETEHVDARAHRQPEKARGRGLHCGGAETRKPKFGGERGDDCAGERRSGGSAFGAFWKEPRPRVSSSEERDRRPATPRREISDETGGSAAEEDLESEADERNARRDVHMHVLSGKADKTRMRPSRHVLPSLSRYGDAPGRGKAPPSRPSRACRVSLGEHLLRLNFFSLPLPSRPLFSVDAHIRGGESDSGQVPNRSGRYTVSPFCLGRERHLVEFMKASPASVASSPSRSPYSSFLVCSSPSAHRRNSSHSRSSSPRRSSSPSLSACVSASVSSTSFASVDPRSPFPAVHSSASSPRGVGQVCRRQVEPRDAPPGPVGDPSPSSPASPWPAQEIQAHGLESCLSLLDALRNVGAALASFGAQSRVGARRPRDCWQPSFASTIDRLLEQLLFLLLPGNANRVALASGPAGRRCPFSRASDWGEDAGDGSAASGEDERAWRSARRRGDSQTEERRTGERKMARPANERERSGRRPTEDAAFWGRKGGSHRQSDRQDSSDTYDGDEKDDNWTVTDGERRLVRGKSEATHRVGGSPSRCVAASNAAQRLLYDDVSAPEESEAGDGSSRSASPQSANRETYLRRQPAFSSSGPPLPSNAVLRLSRVTNPLFSPLVLHLLVRLLASTSARGLPVFFSRLAARLALWPSPQLLGSLLEERQKERRRSRHRQEGGQSEAEGAEASKAREDAEEEREREVLLLPARMAVALCRRCLTACEEEGRRFLPYVCDRQSDADKLERRETARKRAGESKENIHSPESENDLQTQTLNVIVPSSSSPSASPFPAVSSAAAAGGSARPFVGQGVCIVSWEEKEEHEAEKSLSLLTDLLSGLRLALWAALECWKETTLHFFPLLFLRAPAVAIPAESLPASPARYAFASSHPVPAPLHPEGCPGPLHYGATHSASLTFPVSAPRLANSAFAHWPSPSPGAPHRSVAGSKPRWDLSDAPEGRWESPPQGGREPQGGNGERGAARESSARDTERAEGRGALQTAIELHEIFAALRLTLQNLSCAGARFCLARQTHAEPDSGLSERWDFSKRQALWKGEVEVEMGRGEQEEGSRGANSERDGDKETVDAVGECPLDSYDENTYSVSRGGREADRRFAPKEVERGGKGEMASSPPHDHPRDSSLSSEQDGRGPQHVGEWGREARKPQMLNVGKVAQDIRRQKKRLALLRTTDEFVRNCVQTAAFLDHISRADLVPLVSRFAVPHPDSWPWHEPASEDGAVAPEESADGNDDARGGRDGSDAVREKAKGTAGLEGTGAAFGEGKGIQDSGERGERMGAAETHADMEEDVRGAQFAARDEQCTDADEGSICTHARAESDLGGGPQPSSVPLCVHPTSSLSSSQVLSSTFQHPRTGSAGIGWEVESHGDALTRTCFSAPVNEAPSDGHTRPSSWSAGALSRSLLSRISLEARQLSHLRSLLAQASQKDLSGEDTAEPDGASSEAGERRAGDFRSSVSDAPFIACTAVVSQHQRQQERGGDGDRRRFLDFSEGRKLEALKPPSVASTDRGSPPSSRGAFLEKEGSHMPAHMPEVREKKEGEPGCRSSSHSSFDLYERRERRRSRDEAEGDKDEERARKEEEEFAHLMSELIDPNFPDPMSVVDEAHPWPSRLSETDGEMSGKTKAHYSPADASRACAALRTRMALNGNKRKKPSCSEDAGAETARGQQPFFAPSERAGECEERQRGRTLLRPRKIRPVWFSFINSLFNPGSVAPNFRRDEAK
ncbi:conserved hypothetical protein [Neospora caninum Liverpool]|uniref:Uncharacterized protein n=1 Tax=Neospora caninum (strain Liverpool) TaxID=572307 RepID=F0V9C4_NEOCL|nr:conserved hypothetical protein [Neospora caninum Liverpool]CBZ50349.1 conserved hypothetical protein [Neospora caninum Liverpool]|eukprot:XP_003880383.1 conserved hypothetical protein [Neospora caninum Liverpool]